MEKDSVHTILADEFEMQAEWRSEKAKQYPDDKRNAEAVEIFEKLRNSVAVCPADVIETAFAYAQSRYVE